MEACGHTPVWTEQRVLRTNTRGRHIYCERFKAWMVEQAVRPGMSVAGLAMRNQVNANLLRRWMLLRSRREVGREDGPQQDSSSRLVPVTVEDEPQKPTATLRALQHSPDVAVEIELGGALVRVRDGVLPHVLQQVIAALRGNAS